MAEINVGRKDRALLPWVLAGVLLVALVWFLFNRNANGGMASGMRSDSTYRDTSAAAGTLGPASDSTDSARRMPDGGATLPPR